MKRSTVPEDFQVSIKFKLSALWIAVMFCYIYGDFFTLFVPGRINGLINGQTGNGPASPLVLLSYAVLLSIPALMIPICLIFRARLNRMLNIIIGTFYTLIMMMVVLTSLDEWMLFYIYLGILEILMTSVIVIYAIKWPNVTKRDEFI